MASGVFNESGFATAKPNSVAATATALGRDRSPRPEGRSGCVRTNAISCPAPQRARSALAAKGGVPAKTRRKRTLGRLALALLELRADAVLLEFRKVLDEDLPLEVIDFVLDARGQEP